MNDVAYRLSQLNEPFAAGFFEEPGRDNFFRLSRATKRYREVCALPEYNGEYIYPNGKRSIDDFAVMPHFSYTFIIEEDKLSRLPEDLKNICTFGFPRRPKVNMDDERMAIGELYVHANPHYERILEEGLESYKARIMKASSEDFRDGCLEVIESIEIYLDRVIKYLKEVGAREELIESLTVVPMKPARNLYDALVCWNFLYYIDFCDNVGEMDRILDKYYNGEDMTEVIREFFRNVDANDGWSLRIGPTFYPISRQILKASKGIRRPSVELCILENAPEDIWEISRDLIKSGSTNPSFYNYDKYQKLLQKRFPHIPECDLERFCGCGCSETMLSGISRVGSVDGAFNLIYFFSSYMRERLEEAKTFDEFYEGYMSEALKLINKMYGIIDRGYRERAVTRPHPVRTVLIDDCIDNEMDFNAGGARWNWAMVNFSGSINTIESMLAVRELIFRKKVYSAAEFIKLLDNEDETLYKRIKKCPHYGVCDEDADSLAIDFLTRIFSSAEGYKMCFGEGILTSSIQFTTYVRKGKYVPATPDGRRAGDPICDSLTPIMGNDTKGPTTMLSSVASLPLGAALGTPIVNLRMKKDSVDGLLKPLVLGYFEGGGMQLQINCISSEDMRDAMVNPDKHRDLIVRTGGYSEYFVNLSPESQITIIERTEHGA